MEPLNASGTEDRFLRTKAICRFLGISKSTFYRLLGDEASGLSEVVVRLPGVDGLRALRSDLKTWAESGKQPEGRRRAVFEEHSPPRARQ